MTLVLIASAAGAQATALEVEVVPARSAFGAGEPIVIRVLLRNPYDSNEAPYVKRGFWPVPYSSPWDGDLALAMSLTSPSGRTLGATPRSSTLLVRMQTVPQSFERMRPGAAYGEEIVLNGDEFGFQFIERGRYTVAVTVSAAGARDWYDAWLSKSRDDELLTGPGRSENQPTFERNELFAGTLRATTTVDIK